MQIYRFKSSSKKRKEIVWGWIEGPAVIFNCARVRLCVWVHVRLCAMYMRDLLLSTANAFLAFPPQMHVTSQNLRARLWERGKGKLKLRHESSNLSSFFFFFFFFLCLARAFASSIQLDLTEWDWLLVWSGLGRASFLFCSFSLSFFFFQIENYFNEQVNSEQETFFVLSMNELHLRFSWTSFERIPTNLICYRRIFVIAFQRKQGRIHGYPSGVRVGRSSAGEGH